MIGSERGNATITAEHRATFKGGSKTYYNSSVFFPEAVKKDVYVLYGFVRVADDFVDQVPQDGDGFYQFKESYERALAGEVVGDPIIDDFVEVLHRKQFDPAWVDAFLYSMELDLTKRDYATLDETLEYIYGSAEVIGLFMAKILGLDESAYRYAAYQGRSMQYINFIRDIHEDIGLGRVYLPLDDSDLGSLSVEEARKRPAVFRAFIREQIARYRDWQKEAEKGYRYIPARYRIPIKTASDMYGWTANEIAKDPFIVFERQIKPSKTRILMKVLANTIGAVVGK